MLIRKEKRRKNDFLPTDTFPSSQAYVAHTHTYFWTTVVVVVSTGTTTGFELTTSSDEFRIGWRSLSWTSVAIVRVRTRELEIEYQRKITTSLQREKQTNNMYVCVLSEREEVKVDAFRKKFSDQLLAFVFYWLEAKIEGRRREKQRQREREMREIRKEKNDN